MVAAVVGLINIEVCCELERLIVLLVVDVLELRGGIIKVVDVRIPLVAEVVLVKELKIAVVVVVDEMA